jgi:hypothetical protein
MQALRFGELAALASCRLESQLGLMLDVHSPSISEYALAARWQPFLLPRFQLSSAAAVVAEPVAVASLTAVGSAAVGVGTVGVVSVVVVVVAAAAAVSAAFRALASQIGSHRMDQRSSKPGVDSKTHSQRYKSQIQSRKDTLCAEAHSVGFEVCA